MLGREDGEATSLPASDERRYRILDNPLTMDLPSGYASNMLARGIVPTDVFDSGLLPGFLACTRCNSGVMHPSMHVRSTDMLGRVMEPITLPVEGSREKGSGGGTTSRLSSLVDTNEHGEAVERLNWWLLGGNVLVCLECGADLT